MLLQFKTIFGCKPLPYVCGMIREQQKEHSTMRQILLVVGIAIGLLIILSQANAQEKNIFLYGEVTTINGDKYTGALRWGNDEVYWTDLLNAEKTSNDFLKFLSKKEIQQMSDQEGGNSWLGIDFGVLSIWEDKFTRTNHQFDTRFGDIKSVKPSGRSRAQVTLKNGVILEVIGSNHEDIGTSVSIMDYELGEIKIDWNRMEKVDFMESGKKLEHVFGEPIFAKVNAGRRGTFKGTVQWDQGVAKNSHNERFLDDILNGKDRDGEKQIPFRSIAKITKSRNGVEVILKSGREFFLTGSNDVNNENSGILVNDPEVGQVVIPWRDFETLEMLDDTDMGMSYSDFPVSKGLTATVITIDGEEYKGLLAYDLDEAWEFEILDGKDDRVTYKIPFRNIKNIIPKNYAYSMVILKNGTNLLLGESRDVSDQNDGVLVFPSKNAKPEFIRWSKIDEIIFD